MGYPPRYAVTAGLSSGQPCSKETSVYCSAILGAHGPIGILFNNTALTRSALDEAKQARAAVLCSFLGRALDPCRKKRTSISPFLGANRHAGRQYAEGRA